MDTELKEYEFVTLEDGLEYAILDEIEIDGIKYLYLSNEDDGQKFKVRKSSMAGNIEMLVGLDSDEEFDKAMLYFTKKHGNDLK
ncbi:MAG: hypothetical protein II625_01120 [Bacilli bacterium]|nr:hypothetical protein [Bacilli bacterium]